MLKNTLTSHPKTLSKSLIPYSDLRKEIAWRIKYSKYHIDKVEHSVVIPVGRA